MKGSDRGIPAAPPAGPQRISVTMALQLAEDHRQKGNLAAAADLCRRILQAQPRNAEALHTLGLVAHQSGDLPAAVEHVRAAAECDGKSSLYWCNLGELLRLSGRPKDAIAAAERALAIDRRNASACNNRGIAEYDLGDFEAAERSYRRAIALSPRYAEAYSNLGNVLRAAKRLDEAVAAYRHALRIEPRFADAHNNLGTTLRDTGAIAEAERSYLAALALRPDDPAILANLALALRDLARLDEAEAILRRALAIDPRGGRALVNLALVLLDRDRVEEAEAAARSALAARPEDPEVLNALGRVLARQGRPEEAIGFYRRALALAPDLADAHNNLGIALIELGELDAAREALRRAVSLDRRHAGAYMNLAEAEKLAPGDPDLAAMRALARDPAALTMTQRMHLHFGLGKALGDAGEAERAFHHMLEGNRLKRSQIRYDEAAVLGAFDRIRQVFTRSLIEARSGHGNVSRLPIFIVGMPRSGTTLVEQILASHPRVHGAGELEDLARIVGGLRQSAGDYPEAVAALGPDRPGAIAEQYLEALGQRSGGAERVTDKMPSNFYFIGLIHLALPGASIVHVRRDPVDTCLSCFSKLFASPQNHTYDLAELGRYYRKYAELMAHWREVLPPERMLEVRYEDLVADFERAARRILAHCGLEWDDACRSFHRTARPVRTASATQVRQPLYGSAVGRGNAFREFLTPLLRELPGTPGPS